MASQYDGGPVSIAMAMDAPRRHVFVGSSSTAGPLGVPRGGLVTILDADTGSIVRRVPVAGGAAAIAVDAATGRAFVADATLSMTVARPTGHLLQMLGTRSGALLRTVALPGSPCGPVSLDYPCIGAVDERALHVFFAVNVPNAPAGMVVMLDARSGTVLRGTAIPGFPYAVAIDPRTRHLFVAAPIPGRADGMVRILDTATGRLTGSVAVGGVPLELAVDARTDRGVRPGDRGRQAWAGRARAPGLRAALAGQHAERPGCQVGRAAPHGRGGHHAARSPSTIGPGTPSSPACAPERSASSTQRGDSEYAALSMPTACTVHKHRPSGGRICILAVPDHLPMAGTAHPAHVPAWPSGSTLSSVHPLQEQHHRVITVIGHRNYTVVRTETPV